MILGLDDIGVVVKDLPKAIQLLEKLGLTVGEKETIEKDLTQLKGTAQRLAPQPGRRVVMAEDDARPVRSVWGWRTAWGMALATLSVVAFIWWYTTAGGPGNGTTLVAESGFDSDPEMVEVSFIVENPLPQAYLAIAVETVAEEQ